MSKLTKFFGSRQSSADLAVALEKARVDLTAAESAVETSKSAYDSALLDESPAALRKLHDGITDASIEADRATAVIAKLERQHAEAIEAEAADVRQRRHDEAKAASEAVEKRLRSEYPKAALAIRDLLAELAAASLAARAANADRPEGAPPLVDPEHSRSQANLYHEVLAEDVVDMWTSIDSAMPIDTDLQKSVRSHEKRRRGMMQDRDDSEENPLQYGVVQTEHGHLEVVRKRFRRAKFLPDQAGRHIGSLASEIVLPPLDADATPFWKPAYDAHAAARQASAALQPKPARSEREPQFSYSLVKQ